MVLRKEEEMRTLIVDDDFTSRFLMQELLVPYGVPHIAVNGREAVEATRAALTAGKSYDLICLDIMMPDMDGQAALKEIRRVEEKAGILSGDGAKVIMTTALHDGGNVRTAFREQCDGYLVKPIKKPKLLDTLRTFGLLA